MALLILTLLAFCRAGWESPVKVVPAFNESHSVFFDTHSGVSHVLWCSKPDHIFHYRQLHPDDSLSPIIVLNWSQPCNATYSLHGASNGKNLYLIFQGKRSRKNPALNCFFEPETCYDVYFSESADGGHTWSQPKAVRRKDMDDREDRLRPSLLVTREGRLWVFYRMEELWEGEFYYCVRAPGSSVFELEVRLPLIVSVFSATQTVHEGTSRITVYFSRRDHIKTFRYYTSNNGISWHGPFPAQYCDSRVMEKYPFNSPAIPSHLYTTCRDTKWINTLKESSDGGDSWREIPVPDLTLMDAFSVAKSDEGKVIVSYAVHTIAYMQLEEKKFKKLTAPPIAKFTSCTALASSYRLNKFFFWYTAFDKNHTASLWVVKADIPPEHSP